MNPTNLRRIAVFAVMSQQMPPVVVAMSATLEHLKRTYGAENVALHIFWVLDPYAKNGDFLGDNPTLLRSLHADVTHQYSLDLEGELDFERFRKILRADLGNKEYDQCVLCAQGGRKRDALAVYVALRERDPASAYSYLENRPIRLVFEPAPATPAEAAVTPGTNWASGAIWPVPSARALGSQTGREAYQILIENLPEGQRDSFKFEQHICERLKSIVETLPAIKPYVHEIGQGIEWRLRGLKLTDWDAFLQLVDGTVFLFEAKKYAIQTARFLKKNVDAKYLNAALDTLARCASSESKLVVTLGIEDRSVNSQGFENAWREIDDHFARYPRVQFAPVFLGNAGRAWARQKSIANFNETVKQFLLPYIPQ